MKRFEKYAEIISYLFFGVCTVAVNMGVYSLCYKAIKMGNLPATVVAWISAVIFAFFSNKLLVFKSQQNNKSDWVQECARFLACRIFSGFLDVAIMAVVVDCFGGDAVFWKMLSNVVVTVFNYMASKCWIFVKNKK